MKIHWAKARVHKCVASNGRDDICGSCQPAGAYNFEMGFRFLETLCTAGLKLFVSCACELTPLCSLWLKLCINLI